MTVNILFLNHNKVWESTFNRGFYFGRALAKRRHKVTLVTNSKTGRFSFKEYEEEGVTILESPDLMYGRLRTGWDPINTVRRIRYLRSRKFDIIHALDCRPTVILPAIYLKKHLRVPLIIDWADWWGRGGAISIRKPVLLNKLFEPIETFFEEKFRKYADYTTVISPLLKERAIRLGIRENEIRFIPHGCDIDTIYPTGKKEARKRLGLDEDGYIIMFSGFVLYDTELVAKAYDLVRKKYPKTKLILSGNKNILRDILSKKIAFDNNILNIGFVPKEKFLLYLSSADLCLMPLSDSLANRARFPGRLGDYMASGRPIISNPIGEAGKIVEKYDLGLLTKSDAASYAAGIMKMLEDESARDQWGINARKTAEQFYSFDILCREFEDIYHKTLNKRPGTM